MDDISSLENVGGAPKDFWGDYGKCPNKGNWEQLNGSTGYWATHGYSVDSQMGWINNNPLFRSAYPDDGVTDPTVQGSTAQFLVNNNIRFIFNLDATPGGTTTTVPNGYEIQVIGPDDYGNLKNTLDQYYNTSTHQFVDSKTGKQVIFDFEIPCAASIDNSKASYVQAIWAMQFINTNFPESGGIDFHCKQGTDRTGGLAALLTYEVDPTNKEALNFTDQTDPNSAAYELEFHGTPPTSSDYNFDEAMLTGGTFDVQHPGGTVDGGDPGLFTYTYDKTVYYFSWADMLKYGPDGTTAYDSTGKQITLPDSYSTIFDSQGTHKWPQNIPNWPNA